LYAFSLGNRCHPPTRITAWCPRKYPIYGGGLTCKYEGVNGNDLNSISAISVDFTWQIDRSHLRNQSKSTNQSGNRLSQGCNQPITERPKLLGINHNRSKEAEGSRNGRIENTGVWKLSSQSLSTGPYAALLNCVLLWHYESSPTLVVVSPIHTLTTVKVCPAESSDLVPITLYSHDGRSPRVVSVFKKYMMLKHDGASWRT
jgi:hypothetical protein